MGNRLTKIYTKTGDDGSTGLGDGSRVSKDSARVTAYGTVDEANSAIGLVLACDLPDDVRSLLVSVQNFAYPAMPQYSMPTSTILNSSWTPSMPICRRLRISSCPAAA